MRKVLMKTFVLCIITPPLLTICKISHLRRPKSVDTRIFEHKPQQSYLYQINHFHVKKNFMLNCYCGHYLFICITALRPRKRLYRDNPTFFVPVFFILHEKGI